MAFVQKALIALPNNTEVSEMASLDVLVARRVVLLVSSMQKK